MLLCRAKGILPVSLGLLTRWPEEREIIQVGLITWALCQRRFCNGGKGESQRNLQYEKDSSTAPALKMTRLCEKACRWPLGAERDRWLTARQEQGPQSSPTRDWTLPTTWMTLKWILFQVFHTRMQLSPRAWSQVYQTLSHAHQNFESVRLCSN